MLISILITIIVLLAFLCIAFYTEIRDLKYKVLQQHNVIKALSSMSKTNACKCKRYTDRIVELESQIKSKDAEISKSENNTDYYNNIDC